CRRDGRNRQRAGRQGGCRPLRCALGEDGGAGRPAGREVHREQVRAREPGPGRTGRFGRGRRLTKLDRSPCGRAPVAAGARRAAAAAAPAARWHDPARPMHAPDAPDATNAVAASEVTRRYGEEATAVDALRGVSLAVGVRELVAVMGPSGSGKSTLMHVLAGLDKPTQGSVQIAGVEITAMDDAALTRLRREHIGFVFQFFNLLPMLSAEENIVLPLAIAGEHADREWLEELLARTGLSRR